MAGGRFFDRRRDDGSDLEELPHGIDLAEAQRRLRGRYPGLPRIHQLPDAAHIADEILALEKREDSLAFFLEDCEAPAGVRQRFLGNLRALPAGPLRQVAPFAHHCVRTTLIFHLALMNHLVGSRSTNRIDLEYLFYAPLGNGFSSKDNFLVAMAGIILTDQQVFLHGEELRSDLLSLAEMWEKFTPAKRRKNDKFRGHPKIPLRLLTGSGSGL